MKARVIATGKIVDVVENGNYYDTIDNKERYYGHELDFNDTADYWTKLEHQYAGMAMQGLILTASKHMGTDQEVAQWAKEYAHALVEKMKESK